MLDLLRRASKSVGIVAGGIATAIAKRRVSTGAIVAWINHLEHAVALLKEAKGMS